jgi:hypothetical protein
MICPFLSATTKTTVKCIGEACDGWRVVPPTTPETGLQRVIVAANPTAEREDDAGPKPPAVPKGWCFTPYNGNSPAKWVEPVERARKRQVGYCGIKCTPFALGA